MTQLLLNAPAIECSFCGDEFDREEKEYGYRIDPRDGAPTCDECYREHFEFDCIRCGEYGDVEDQHRYLVILEECDDLAPGIYRINRKPYWMSNYFSMTWIKRALSRLRDADGKYANLSEFPSGHLCLECQHALNLVEQVAAHPGRDAPEGEKMPMFRVEYHGYKDIEADSAMEAECDAAFDCRPDNCRAEELNAPADDEE